MSGVIRAEILPSEIFISEAELSARMGMKVTLDDPIVRSVISDVLANVEVRCVAARIGIVGIEENRVILDGFSVASGALSSYLKGCRETYIFALTLGSSIDRLIKKKKTLSLADGFVYDAVSSAVTEGACDAAEKKLFCTAPTKNRYSPGYSDCPLTVQKDLLGILSADKLIGIKLLDSLLMTPMKSVTAFAAIIP